MLVIVWIARAKAAVDVVVVDGCGETSRSTQKSRTKPKYSQTPQFLKCSSAYQTMQEKVSSSVSSAPSLSSSGLPSKGAEGAKRRDGLWWATQRDQADRARPRSHRFSSSADPSSSSLSSSVVVRKVGWGVNCGVQYWRIMRVRGEEFGVVGVVADNKTRVARKQWQTRPFQGLWRAVPFFSLSSFWLSYVSDRS